MKSMKKVLLLCVLIFAYICGFAQTAKISGKVINAGSGQALSGANIFLVEKTTATTTDINGNFVFSKLAAGTYSIKCSYVGYLEKIIDEITIKDNENFSINISLEEKKATQSEVVITSTRTRAAKESVASLLVAQKNSASVSDGISAESIKKTPDRSTSDVLKRVSGASIQDDRFAIIRGLNDRYNAAFINGAPLPSTESDRKAFAFDIFPSAILDNLVIYKTATPDRSGEFAGGIIDISTKSIPQQSFLSISFGVGYNSAITGKDRFYSENKGNKDFLGIDDGTRGIPSGLPSQFKGLTFAQKGELAKQFNTYKWGIKQGNTSPNYNFQIAKGFNIERKGKEFLGALLSVNYNRNYTFLEGERNTFDYDIDPNVELAQRGRFIDSIYNEETVLALLANISVKLNNRNNISWKNNFSINTDNRIIKRIGAPDYTTDSFYISKDIVRWYTSNQIFSSQLAGEHQVGPIKTKINWLGSYSKVQREIPNLSRTSYIGYQPDLQAFIPNGQLNQIYGSGTMLFANTDEDIKSIKVDITQSYKFLKSSQNSVKIGAGYQKRKRDFTTRLFGFSPYNNGGVSFDYSLLSLPEERIFLPENLGVMANGNGGFLVNEGTISNSNYNASSELVHGYIMGDQRFFKKFRLIFGARIEQFKQKLNTINDSLSTDPPINLNTTVTDFLPSVNFVYAVTPKMNIRLSYSQTVNRPEFRELAPYLFFDYVSQYTFEGLDSLQRATIKNYDFRYEFYPGKAQIFSVSAFYKEFENPIEIVSIPGASNNQAIYSNAKSAEVYGVEAEFRTLISTLIGIKREGSFLSKFTLSANAALVKSKLKLGRVGFFDLSQQVTDRALQGQSPYLINGSLGFNDEKLGISATVSVNRVGDRIYIAGIKDQSADIYEKARTVLDFQVSKLILKNKLELKLTGRDILAQNISFYSDYDLSKSYTARDKYFSSYKAPKIFSFSASYKF